MWQKACLSSGWKIQEGFGNNSLTSPNFYLLLVAVDCGPLSVPTNGSSSGNSTLYPNSLLFNCEPGFILNGSSKRTCQADGKWSGLSTLCVGRFETSHLGSFFKNLLLNVKALFHTRNQHEFNRMWNTKY